MSQLEEDTNSSAEASAEQEDDADLKELQNKVQLINKNVIGKKSRDVYVGKQIQFIHWLDETNSALLSEEFLESASRDQKGLLQRSFVKQVLLDATLPPPIRFDKLSSNDIQLFVASLKKKKRWQCRGILYSQYHSLSGA